MTADQSVLATTLLATLLSFAESGWFLLACLILLALLVLGVLWMICLRGSHRELDELERYFDRGEHGHF